MARPRETGRPMDRARTEQALEDAALALLAEDGVLAGLNLQKVADRADVNRGLVYHYFGSRRELLRKALRANTPEWQAGADAFYHLPFTKRLKLFLRSMVAAPRAAWITLLLAIDGDTGFRMVDDGFAEGNREAYERDKAEGRLAEDVDVEALNVAVVSLVFAYAVRRKTFAKEYGVPVKELDRRVEVLVDRMLKALAPAAEGAAEVKLRA